MAVPAPKDKRLSIEPALLERLSDAAFWEETTVKSLIQRVMNEFLERRAKERGQPYGKRLSSRGRPSEEGEIDE
jgi:hypothetical protein